MTSTAKFRDEPALSATTLADLERLEERAAAGEELSLEEQQALALAAEIGRRLGRVARALAAEMPEARRHLLRQPVGLRRRARSLPVLALARRPQLQPLPRHRPLLRARTPRVRRRAVRARARSPGRQADGEGEPPREVALPLAAPSRTGGWR